MLQLFSYCINQIPYQMAPRRTGDVDECYADPTIAERELGWKAKYGLNEMCKYGWPTPSPTPCSQNNYLHFFYR